MNISRMLVAAGCAVALLGAAPAAFAQRGGGGHGGGGGGGFHGGGMGGGFRGGGVGSMMGHGGGFRGGPGPMIGTRGMSGGPFIHGGGPIIRGGSPFIRGGGPFISNGGFVHNGGFVRGGAFVNGHGFNGHGFVTGPARFYGPYYAFQPRLSLGFGLWAGYPFAYPYAFYNPFFYYPYGSSYGSSYSGDYSSPNYPEGYLSSDESAPTYSTSWSSMVQPDQTNMGGMSFDVTPATAELFVDNMRVGTVGQFTPTTQPVGLPAGHHHIEVRSSGYQTMSFDVDIVAGEVTPFQGTMEPN